MARDKALNQNHFHRGSRGEPRDRGYREIENKTSPQRDQIFSLSILPLCFKGLFLFPALTALRDFRLNPNRPVISARFGILHFIALIGAIRISLRAQPPFA
jgi:hypothetical protein